MLILSISKKSKILLVGGSRHVFVLGRVTGGDTVDTARPSGRQSNKDFLRAYLPRHLPNLSLLLVIFIEQLISTLNWNWNLVIFPDSQRPEGQAEEERDSESQEDWNHVAGIIILRLIHTFSIKPTGRNVEWFAWNIVNYGQYYVDNFS